MPPRSRASRDSTPPQGLRDDFYTPNPAEPTLRLWKALGLPA